MEVKPTSKKRQALSTYNTPNKVSLLYEENSMFVSKIFSNSQSLNNKNSDESDSVSFQESSFYSSFESSYLSDMDSTIETKTSSPLSIDSRQSNHFIYTSNLWCRRQLNNSQEEVISNVNMQTVVNNIPQGNDNTPVAHNVNKQIILFKTNLTVFVQGPTFLD